MTVEQLLARAIAGTPLYPTSPVVPESLELIRERLLRLRATRKQREEASA